MTMILLFYIFISATTLCDKALYVLGIRVYNFEMELLSLYVYVLKKKHASCVCCIPEICMCSITEVDVVVAAISAEKKKPTKTLIPPIPKSIHDISNGDHNLGFGADLSEDHPVNQSITLVMLLVLDSIKAQTYSFVTRFWKLIPCYLTKKLTLSGFLTVESMATNGAGLS